MSSLLHYIATYLVKPVHTSYHMGVIKVEALFLKFLIKYNSQPLVTSEPQIVWALRKYSYNASNKTITRPSVSEHDPPPQF